MTGQMCWFSRFGSDGEKILHLRLNPHEPWVPYTSLPEYMVPDYKDFPNGSKGWATLQKLCQANWTLVPSPKTYETPISMAEYVPKRIAS